MKYLAIYYAIGVLHLLGTLATNKAEYDEIVDCMKAQEPTLEVYMALLVVLAFMPVIWPQILFYQIFDKEVE